MKLARAAELGRARTPTQTLDTRVEFSTTSAGLSAIARERSQGTSYRTIAKESALGICCVCVCVTTSPLGTSNTHTHTQTQPASALNACIGFPVVPRRSHS